MLLAEKIRMHALTWPQKMMITTRITILKRISFTLYSNRILARIFFESFRLGFKMFIPWHSEIVLLYEEFGTFFQSLPSFCASEVNYSLNNQLLELLTYRENKNSTGKDEKKSMANQPLK